MKDIFKTICLVVFVLACVVCEAQESMQVTAETLKAIKAGGELTGPTVFLGFDEDNSKDNSISAFMYFVPMISTVPVDAMTSPVNRQKTRMVTCKRKQNSKSFEVVCEFEMRGNGYHKNTFDAAEVIKEMKDEADSHKPLKNIIDYIMFEGSGRGSIKVKGRIADGVEQVKTVEVTFNEDGCKSPVTIGLYTIKPDKGRYTYKGRSNKIVARVNTLKFRNNSTDPKMGIELASIRGGSEKDGLLSRIKGKIANLFIKPIKVSQNGNDAMMDFGGALYRKHASFTFPKAKNLKTKNKTESETIVARAEKRKSQSVVSAN